MSLIAVTSKSCVGPRAARGSDLPVRPKPFIAIRVPMMALPVTAGRTGRLVAHPGAAGRWGPGPNVPPTCTRVGKRDGERERARTVVIHDLWP